MRVYPNKFLEFCYCLALPGQKCFWDPVVIESICYLTRAKRLINEGNTTRGLRKIWMGTRPKMFLGSSRNRVDLLSYDSKTTDKREQYDWMAGKIWTGKSAINNGEIYNKSARFSFPIQSLCFWRGVLPVIINFIISLHCSGVFLMIWQRPKNSEWKWWIVTVLINLRENPISGFLFFLQQTKETKETWHSIYLK